jgi:hypothetical protein
VLNYARVGGQCYATPPLFDCSDAVLHYKSAIQDEKRHQSSVVQSILLHRVTNIYSILVLKSHFSIITTTTLAFYLLHFELYFLPILSGHSSGLKATGCEVHSLADAIRLGLQGGNWRTVSRVHHQQLSLVAPPRSCCWCGCSRISFGGPTRSL